MKRIALTLVALFVSIAAAQAQYVVVTGPMPAYDNRPLPPLILKSSQQFLPQVDPIGTLSAQVDRLEKTVTALTQALASQAKPDPTLTARIAALEAQSAAKDKQIADLTDRVSKALDLVDKLLPAPPPSFTPVPAPVVSPPPVVAPQPVKAP